MQKSTENLHTDFKTMNTGFSVVKDKMAICQADIAQFVIITVSSSLITVSIEQAVQSHDE